MAPPIPPNPSFKDIIEEAIQISTQHLNNAMQETQEQMNVRFGQISLELSNLQTKWDNDKSIEDSRYDTVMSILNKISLQNAQQSNPTSTATVHGSGTGTVSRTV